MDNETLTFIKAKRDELLENGGILILKPKYTSRIPDLAEITRKYKDIKSFYIGDDEDRRIVLEYCPYIPNLDVSNLKKNAEKAFYTKDYPKAIKYYLILLPIRKKLPHIYARLGLSYLNIGEFYKAIDYLTVATELSKNKKNGKYDFTDLINNLLKREPEELEPKPKVTMQEKDFQDDFSKYYENTRIKEVATLVNFQNMSIEEACNSLSIGDEEKNIIMLLIAKESYARQDFSLGDRILKRVEVSPSKTPKVKDLLQEIRLRKKFYQNSLSEDYEPLIKVRAKAY